MQGARLRSYWPAGCFWCRSFPGHQRGVPDGPSLRERPAMRMCDIPKGRFINTRKDVRTWRKGMPLPRGATQRLGSPIFTQG